MDIGDIILADPINRWIFHHEENACFLVGGYIRDILRGETPGDKDFVVKNSAMECAKKAAKEFNGTLIAFRKKETYRVVLRDGQYIDFNCLNGSIQKDLSARDFTINAMAWSPGGGLVDPCHGLNDLEGKKIKIIAPGNLSADPLRVLRAYRIAAQMSFDIDRESRGLLRKYARGLKNVAAERITEEIFKLLQTDNVYDYLMRCSNDNVLREVVNVTKGNLRINILDVSNFDLFLSDITKRHMKPLTKLVLNKKVDQGLTKIGFLRLFLLLGGLNLSLDLRAVRLQLSNHLNIRLQRLSDALELCRGRMTENRLYEIFSASRGNEMEAALLVGLVKKRNVDKYVRSADFFVKNRRNVLLDGYEIQKILQTGPGKSIGEILSEVERRRFLGTIRNKTEARKWILSNLT